MWQQRLEAARAKAEAERLASADSLAAAAAQREQQLLAQLAASQQGVAAKLAEAEKEWMLKQAAAQERALKVSCGAGLCREQGTLTACGSCFPAAQHPLHLACSTLACTQEQHELERRWVERLRAAERAATEEQVGLFGHLA